MAQNYGDDSGFYMEGDDSLFMPDATVRQRALSANVRRNPALAMASGGVSTPKAAPVAPPTPSNEPAPPPQAPAPGSYADFQRQFAARSAERPDQSRYEQIYKDRNQDAKQKLMLGLTLASMGGRSMANVGQELTQHGLKQGGEYEVPGGWGVVGASGYVPNEEKIREADLLRLQHLSQAALADEGKKRDDETRKALSGDKSQLALTLAAIKAAGGGSDKLHLQRAGTTPSGEMVSFNPQSGEYLVSGKPYNGQIMSMGALDKQIGVTQEAMASASRAQGLLEKVKANPQAFGGIAALAGYTGQFAGTRIIEKNLSPEARQVRGQVLREAASIINELYGAALTANEERRASGFVPNPNDPPEVVMDKLQQALAWAQSKANTYGQHVRSAAETRSGTGAGAPAPARSAPPKGAVVRVQ